MLGMLLQLYSLKNQFKSQILDSLKNNDVCSPKRLPIIFPKKYNSRRVKSFSSSHSHPSKYDDVILTSGLMNERVSKNEKAMVNITFQADIHIVSFHDDPV